MDANYVQTTTKARPAPSRVHETLPEVRCEDITSAKYSRAPTRSTSHDQGSYDPQRFDPAKKMNRTGTFPTSPVSDVVSKDGNLPELNKLTLHPTSPIDGDESGTTRPGQRTLQRGIRKSLTNLKNSFKGNLESQKGSPSDLSSSIDPISPSSNNRSDKSRSKSRSRAPSRRPSLANLKIPLIPTAEASQAFAQLISSNSNGNLLQRQFDAAADSYERSVARPEPIKVRVDEIREAHSELSPDGARIRDGAGPYSGQRSRHNTILSGGVEPPNGHVWS